ncbi:uncharacterized protein EHS24_005711 [Apiotrichum porosum]|uniref:Uncharacterized protein n=1 Tax=Apiotrichum porosum TaxID=105984 RepID=A0A427XZG1_9TREE|nr:uncharacterized protein EHS24_005711 [Apiotrichum porosum]RSH84202.1 hypothetical protein EHS24_005711 [Apiotrichum porosum]
MKKGPALAGDLCALHARDSEPVCQESGSPHKASMRVFGLKYKLPNVTITYSPLGSPPRKRAQVASNRLPAPDTPAPETAVTETPEIPSSSTPPSVRLARLRAPRPTDPAVDKDDQMDRSPPIKRLLLDMRESKQQALGLIDSLLYDMEAGMAPTVAMADLRMLTEDECPEALTILARLDVMRSGARDVV